MILKINLILDDLKASPMGNAIMKSQMEKMAF